MPSKSELQANSLKSDTDRALFSRIYIACQARDSDSDTFIQHENQIYPPALSNLGKLRPCLSNSDITECLETVHPAYVEHPDVSALILDGAFIVHFF